MDGLTWINTQF